MTPLLTPIHLISELSRVISLSMRLFGNVFAGEVLLATMLALTTAALFILPLAFVVPGVFLGLELLFGAGAGARLRAAVHDLHHAGDRGASPARLS